MPVTTTAEPRLCALPQLQGIAWADIYQRRADGSYCSSFTTAAAVPGAQNAKLLARHGRFAALARLEHTVVRKRTAGTCVEQEPADDAVRCMLRVWYMWPAAATSVEQEPADDAVSRCSSTLISDQASGTRSRPPTACAVDVLQHMLATRVLYVVCHARLDRVRSGSAAGRDRHV